MPGLDLHRWEDRDTLRFLPHPRPCFRHVPARRVEQSRACVPPLGVVSVPKYGDTIDRLDGRLGCREYRDNCLSCDRAMLRLMDQTMCRPVAASSVALSSHCPRLLVRGADRESTEDPGRVVFHLA